MSTTVLVTGGNRGFGKALVEAYLSVPNTTVIATVRDAAKAASLSSVPKAAGSNLLTITMDMGAPDSIAAGMATLPTTHNISALDVVIANAGINGPTPSLSHTPVPEIQKYIDVNAYGPFEVYKAALPLMKASAAGGKKPKFFYVSSAAGCMTSMMNFLPLAGYGASKVLGNFLFKWLSLDNKDVITVSYDPGTIDTDMTRGGLELAKQFGLQPQMGGISFAPADEVARTMKKVIDDANESTSGKFLDRDGKELPY